MKRFFIGLVIGVGIILGIGLMIALAIVAIHAPIGNSKVGESIKLSMEFISVLAVPIVLAIWGIYSEWQKEKVRREKEELKGLGEYAHDYISPFVDKNELKKDFNYNITKVAWNLNILAIMVRESKYHHSKHKQISFLNDLLKKASDESCKDMYVGIINLLTILPSLFYLSDDKFKSIFAAALRGSSIEDTLKMHKTPIDDNLLDKIELIVI